MKATYRVVLDLVLDVKDDQHGDRCQDSLYDAGLELPSNWGHLNPQLAVSDVERTS